MIITISVKNLKGENTTKKKNDTGPGNLILSTRWLIQVFFKQKTTLNTTFVDSFNCGSWQFKEYIFTSVSSVFKILCLLQNKLRKIQMYPMELLVSHMLYLVCNTACRTISVGKYPRKISHNGHDRVSGTLKLVPAIGRMPDIQSSSTGEMYKSAL